MDMHTVQRIAQHAETRATMEVEYDARTWRADRDYYCPWCDGETLAADAVQVDYADGSGHDMFCPACVERRLDAIATLENAYDVKLTDLQRIAREYDIRGRSRMNKHTLASAIIDHEHNTAVLDAGAPDLETTPDAGSVCACGAPVTDYVGICNTCERRETETGPALCPDCLEVLFCGVCPACERRETETDAMGRADLESGAPADVLRCMTCGTDRVSGVWRIDDASGSWCAGADLCETCMFEFGYMKRETDPDGAPYGFPVLEVDAVWHVRTTPYYRVRRADNIRSVTIHNTITDALDRAYSLLDVGSACVEVLHYTPDAYTSEYVLYERPPVTGGGTVRVWSDDWYADLHVYCVFPHQVERLGSGDWYISTNAGSFSVFTDWTSTGPDGVVEVRMTDANGLTVFPDKERRTDRYGSYSVLWDMWRINETALVLESITRRHGVQVETDPDAEHVRAVELLRARAVRDLLEVHHAIRNERVHHADPSAREVLRVVSCTAHMFGELLENTRTDVYGALMLAHPVLSMVADVVSEYCPDHTTPALWRGTVLDIERYIDARTG